MLKFAAKIMSVFWILSPLVFLTLRCVGVFNFRFDWLIGAVLAFISFGVIFLTFKTSIWE